MKKKLNNNLEQIKNKADMYSSSKFESAQEKIERLNAFLEKSIEENHEIRAENILLQNQLKKLQNAQNKLLSSLAEMKKNNSIQIKQLQNLEYQYSHLQQKYDALSNSKLGRLTLYYWEKRSKKNKKDQLEKSFPAEQNANSDSLEIEHQQKQLETTSSIISEPTILIMPKEQENWFDQYADVVNSIPDSNGTKYYQKLNLKIGIICDEFFFDSIKASANFIYLMPDSWKESIDEGIDVLLFVSAWRGLNEEWKGLASISNFSFNKKRQTAIELIEYCNSKAIPTVFYSKEDPPNYALFLDFAKHCNYIYTSAKECVPFYKEDCQNECVNAVTFGINPELHNPIGFYNTNKEKVILFSGSWMKKYPDRCKELSTIFDGIKESSYSLHIIDRNYPQNKNYQFPAEYFSFTSPSLNHLQLQKLHKVFNWAVNINSVKTSETMFANRGFELQANGVLLLSNFSIGVNSILPNVIMIHDSQEVARVVDNMSPEEIYAHQLAGIRSVMSNHTCFDRIQEMLSYTGLNTEQKNRNILIITDKYTEHFRHNYERQTYLHKSYILQNDLTCESIAQYDMITWFDDRSDYGEFYLEDMINAFKYTSCDYVTKDAYIKNGKLIDGTEHNYVNTVKSKYRTVFWCSSYDPDFLINKLNSEITELPNGYSIDHQSYFEGEKQKKQTSKTYKLSVIMPVFNNGNHLYGKGFSSLLHSSMFNDMEIIIVDDGSTDDRTLKIESYIADCYENVRIFRFEDGGSGSASRPRNKGVELAQSEYVTFLDPDNEAISDGYFILYQEAVKGGFDLVIGNMLKCDVNTSVAKNYEKIKQTLGTDTFTNGFGKHLADINFLSISIQAMVIRKQIISSNNILQVVGAAGQDTLFSWQLLQSSKKIKAIDIPVHVYYSQTLGSVTNQVRPKFFEKLLLLQQPKYDWLVQADLIDDFMKLRYDYYTKNWIFKKLSIADDPEECAKIVKKIHDVFKPHYHNTDGLINNFSDLCERNDYAKAVQIVKDSFPNSKLRPMPTLEEILQANKKKAVMQIFCHDTDGTFTFNNCTKTEDNATFAWVILSTEGEYQKVDSSKYSEFREFVYDFTKLSPAVYKVRAFILESDGKKKSEDVAYIDVDENHKVRFLDESSAILQ